MRAARYRNGWCVPTPVLRATWAMVTRDPAIHGRTIAKRLHVAHATAHRALRALRDAGYIDYADRAKAARTILVPFVTSKRKQ